MKKRIPVAEAVLAGNERKYVLDCLESGWISGSGKYVNAFEESFASFCGVAEAVTVANGTVALHLALVALEIGPGDEVIVPDLTYVASANAVAYCGARPVFVDVDPITWTVDVDDVRRKITPATRAIMPVHLYGHPSNMSPLRDLATAHGLTIVEDAAEAHGAECYGERVGSIGHAATFSFYGNKIITTGEGGMITTNDRNLAARLRLLRGQGMDPSRRYWFPVVGYNYRLTNVQAAIGLAQLERIHWFIERRREVATWYADRLATTALTLPIEADWARNVYWLYSVLLPEGVNREAVMRELDGRGIETRPFFYPMHVLPPYEAAHGDRLFPVTTSVASRGINLPSSATLTETDVDRICADLLAVVRSQSVSNPVG